MSRSTLLSAGIGRSGSSSGHATAPDLTLVLKPSRLITTTIARPEAAILVVSPESSRTALKSYSTRSWPSLTTELMPVICSILHS